MNISVAREVTNQGISVLQYEVGKTALETLKMIKFNIPVGCNLFTQREIAEQNIVLDQVSCLGRVAQSVAIVEKHHSGCNIEVAEVLEDYFQSIMMRELANDSKKSYDDTFIQELLLYEEPHSVLVVNGVQFDPISVMFDADDIVHAKIMSNSSWKSICACVLVAQSHLVDSVQSKMDILVEAERLCPGLLVVAENMIGAHIMLGDVDEAMKMLNQLLTTRTSARTLYCIYLLTNDTNYRDKLVDTYTEGVFNYLEDGQYE